MKNSQNKQQSNKPGKPEQGEDKCDYLHPEECEKQSGKNNLDETKRQVQEQADKFIDEENESKDA